MIRSACLLLVLGVAGCSDQIAVRTTTVKVPVAVSCVPPGLAGPPAYPDTDEALIAAPGPAERYRLLVVGREARRSRNGVLEGVVNACREVPHSE